MAGKKVWVTWLPGKEDENELQTTIKELQMVGLEVSGAPWVDELEKSGWTELADILSADDSPDLWLVAGRESDFNLVRNRYALSLMSASLAQTNPLLKVFTRTIDQSTTVALPDLCSNWQSLEGPGWNAKVVAAAYTSASTLFTLDCHISVIAHSAIGQWFEIGPKTDDEPWSGAMFGVSGEGAEIGFQAVGDRGQLPEKSVNEFASKGIEAEIGEDQYIACSLQNNITSTQSYYVKVQGVPNKIMFGGHPGTDKAEVQVVSLT